MNLEQLLNSGGELIGYGFETIKKPYEMNINFFPEFFGDKKYKFKRGQRLSYLTTDCRSMNHWNPTSNKVFDVDLLENNWQVFNELRKYSKFHTIQKLDFEYAIPSISLGRTFFLGKISRSTDPNLFLNNFNFYACSQFLIKDMSVYIPFKIRIQTKQTTKRKTVQEFYENIDHDSLIQSKVLCANTILPNLPMKVLQPMLLTR